MSMANYKPKDLAAFLRRCCNGICDDSRPCAEVHMDCDVELMRMAAELLEEVAGDD